MLLFLFFKQKTAYEMRISDWSSDVCSSDLPAPRPQRAVAPAAGAVHRLWLRAPEGHVQGSGFPRSPAGRGNLRQGPEADARRQLERRGHHLQAAGRAVPLRPVHRRSEAHTSELQSLMRISYAVFCLKKKNTQIHEHHYI